MMSPLFGFWAVEQDHLRICVIYKETCGGVEFF